MKKVLFKVPIIYLLLMLSLAAFSQDKSTGIEGLLQKYYDVKNALVNSEADNAINGAVAFSATLKAVDAGALTPKEQTAFKAVQAKLIADANSIAATKDLEKQRTLFQSLSNYVITLVKSAKLTQPAYIDYCPMKKAFWVSAAEPIKNPYYGNSMLTCGSVKETVQ